MFSQESLVVAADDLRQRSWQSAPPFSTTSIIKTCFPDAVVTGRVLPDGVDEIVTKTKDGPLIVYKRGLPIAEQRYAIAHAIGHLVYDMNAEADAAAIGFAGNPRCERRADLFGAELLVPLSLLTRYVQRWPSMSGSHGANHEAYLDQVDQLAARFNAPVPVILDRIRRLECLTKIHGEIVLTE